MLNCLSFLRIYYSFDKSHTTRVYRASWQYGKHINWASLPIYLYISYLALIQILFYNNNFKTKFCMLYVIHELSLLLRTKMNVFLSCLPFQCHVIYFPSKIKRTFRLICFSNFAFHMEFYG